MYFIDLMRICNQIASYKESICYSIFNVKTLFIFERSF